MVINTKSIWLTWENQPRNRGIARFLNIPLFEFVHDDKAIIIRYCFCLFQTIKAFSIIHPKIAVVQNPSLILALLAICLKPIYRHKLIIDAHNVGLRPMDGRSGLLMLLSRWIQRKANLIIVTNEVLKHEVEQNHGKAFILPDKLPEKQVVGQRLELEKEIRIVFVCSFKKDEPYWEVFKAAKLLSKQICIYVTGCYPISLNTSELSSNIKLLGYLSIDNYWELLESAHAIMDLTTREDCLVCGAYEGTSLGKPLILSNTNALRTYFNKGCVYSDSTGEAIANAINELISNYNCLRSEMMVLINELTIDWNQRANDLILAINSL